MIVVKPGYIRRVQQVLAEKGFYPNEQVDDQNGPLTQDGLDKLADALRAGVAVDLGVEPTPVPAAGVTPTVLAAAIIAQADRFRNLHEVVSNDKWDGPMPNHLQLAEELRADLIRYSGWSAPEAYCIAFAETVEALAYAALGRSADFVPISKLITLGVIPTAQNLNAKGYVHADGLPGDIILFAHGNTGQGHAGIVKARNGNVYTTIEGNTGSSGATGSTQWEGDGIYEKTRTIVDGMANGMKLLGFYRPPPLSSVAA